MIICNAYILKCASKSVWYIICTFNRIYLWMPHTLAHPLCAIWPVRLSRAFSKSTNTTYKELFHSCHCPRIWWRTKMWLMHDISFLRPACYWRSSLSTAVVMCWTMMRQKTLLVMDSSVIALQLLLSDRFPFLGSLKIMLLFLASVSLHCRRRPCGSVEEAVAFPVMLSTSLHTSCRPLVLCRSSTS